MGKCFRPDDLDQNLLLTPSLHDWLPEKHLARFLVDVVDGLDLKAVYASYAEKDGRGQAAYSPRMMVRVLLYGYCTGTCSSRQIEGKTYEDVAFRYLTADTHPDHSSWAEFRQRHLPALAGLFMQALQLCAKAGLVKLGHVALDGSKIQANASKHKAMSYGRMSEAEKKLQEQIEMLLQEAEAVDAAEDEKHGKGQLDAMLEQVEQNLGNKPQAVSADNGYWSGKQITDPHVQGIDLHVATGKQKHGEPQAAGDASPPRDEPESLLLEQMRQKLKTEAGREVYRMRKAIVEPVVGQIKERRE